MLEEIVNSLGLDPAKEKVLNYGLRFALEKNNLPEPDIDFVDSIRNSPDIAGTFSEFTRKIRLSRKVFRIVSPEERAFHLTHEIIHYIDFATDRKSDLSEDETDVQALNSLVRMGVIRPSYIRFSETCECAWKGLNRHIQITHY